MGSALDNVTKVMIRRGCVGVVTFLRILQVKPLQLFNSLAYLIHQPFWL